MPLNPFIVKAKQKMFTDQGLGIGDRVTITWKDTYGTERTHTGTITEFDDWLRSEGSSYWHYPITMIESVRAAS